MLSSRGGDEMIFRVQLSAELSNHIRTLVHETVNERKNRQKIEQLGTKIRGQLDELSGRNRSTVGLRVDLRSIQND